MMERYTDVPKLLACHTHQEKVDPARSPTNGPAIIDPTHQHT